MVNINQGASQTILPNGAGVVNFDQVGQDVSVNFVSDATGDPGNDDSGPDQATATVHFMFSAGGQDCQIDVVFSEGFGLLEGP